MAATGGPWIRLLRESAGREWCENCLFADLALAWRSTHRLLREEHETDPRFEAVVVRLDDWRAGRRVVGLQPPPGFDTSLPVGRAEAADVPADPAGDPAAEVDGLPW